MIIFGIPTSFTLQNTYLFMCPGQFLSLKYNAGFFSQSHLIVLPSLTPQTDISIFTDLDRSPNSLAGSYNLLMSPACLLMPRPFPSETFSTPSPEMDSKQVRLFPHQDPSGVPFFSSSKNSACFLFVSLLSPTSRSSGRDRTKCKLCQPVTIFFICSNYALHYRHFINRTLRETRTAFLRVFWS